jgi:RNA polymerase sigma-70 factor (ECF subfamily)
MNIIKHIWPFNKDPHVQFEALVKPHLTKLYRLAYRLTNQRDDAEDLVQEVLLAVYPRLEEMQDIEMPGSWLSRILYRKFVDQYRRQKRSPIDYTDDDQNIYDSAMDTAMQPAERLNSSQTQSMLNMALNKLNEDQRVLIMLHDVEGYTLQEIAEMLDTSIGTLKSRISRARTKLRESIHKMEPNTQSERVDSVKGEEI